MSFANGSRTVGFVAALVVSCVAMLAGSAVAFAGPVWRIDAMTDTTVAPEGTFTYLVQTMNVGDEASSGEISLRAKLPAHVTAVEATLFHDPTNEQLDPGVPCTAGDGVSAVKEATEVLCTNTDGVKPPWIEGVPRIQLVRLTVKVDSGAVLGGTLTSLFTVSGGNAAAASTVGPIRVASVPPGFGVAAFDGQALDEVGGPLTQAGGHPADQSISIDFNRLDKGTPLESTATPVQPVKDVFVDLPAGVVGDPLAANRCTDTQLANGEGTGAKPLCPSSSQVGTLFLRGNNLPLGAPIDGPIPVFNMVPPSNVPARFGFNFSGTVVAFDAVVRNGGDYGISIDVGNISEAIPVAGTTVTFWGVPSDPAHDLERACPGKPEPSSGGPTCPSGAPRVAFLRNPTSCTALGEALTYSMRTDSWANPGVFDTASFATHLAPFYPAPLAEQGAPAGIDGCEKVPFTPSINPQPTSTTPDSASGLNLALSLPQNEDPELIGESDLHKIKIVFPEGMTINPAAANGLAACSEAQIGLGTNNPAACPDASKLGKIEVESPALEKPLKGALYLAVQNENPFHSLLATYMVAEGSGVVLKLAGEMKADPSTGRLTTSFDKVPQLPFSKTTIELFGGSESPLTTPASCGTGTFSTELVGWSGKTVDINSPYTVQCTSGAGGFTPLFTAGATNPRAGAFAPFVISFARNDGEQQISGLSTTLPPGVSAVLKGVERCSEAAIKATETGTGSCPAGSRIGSVTATSGTGADPFSLKGSVYLTGPYNGGAFGEAVVVPAVAGPFNLGNVVVRGSIRIEPHTAQPTVVSDPLPRFVGNTGIPTEVRRIDVALDRPAFTFNATDCNPLPATGALTGSGGTSVDVSARYRADECRSLAFKPGFRVTTVAKTSRTIGAALHVTVTSGPGQANIHSVHVSLPKTLPSRLTTLQKACADRVFEVNPAACPAESRVGMATAVTPLLAARLTGPVYFVSHGGAKFPELTVVLQGEGVTVMLGGETAINEKTNVTSSTFRAVPDTPITRFDLTLPQGRFSALAATANLCKTPLTMPTRIVGQNGAVVQRNTRIAVSGCPHVPVRGKPKKTSRHATNKGHGGRAGHR